MQTSKQIKKQQFKLRLKIEEIRILCLLHNEFLQFLHDLASLLMGSPQTPEWGEFDPASLR